MEQIFTGLPCQIIVDDILVWGKDEEEHAANLKLVLDKAREVNLRLNKSKCKIGVMSVPYIGHILSAEGLQIDPKKTAAIRDMPDPTDKPAVQRFLGLVNYVSKFIENVSDKAKPLRELLTKEAEFIWEDRQKKAFNQLKDDLVAPPVLRYFDSKKSVKLTCDASKSGLGAACLQDDMPIAYASKSLTPTQCNYAQNEKELLSVVFACTRFHDYVYGREVTVETDHQPLISITKKPLQSALTRLQKMLMLLQRYNIKLVFRKGKEMYVADTLSCAYTNQDDLSLQEDWYEIMTIAPVSSTRLQQLKEETKKDEKLQRLTKIILSGWPTSENNIHSEIREYFKVRDELTVVDGTIMKGTRVVIPEALRDSYIKSIHSGHPGAESTKRRARETIYWPGLSKDIDQAVGACSTCNSTKSHLQKEEMQMHDIPELPWQIVATDIFDWDLQQYLVLVDSYSGWYDFTSLPNMQSSTVIRKLRKIFSMHGSPEKLFSDNARQFTSANFQRFCEEWDITHVTSSPAYPQSNGLAERAVQSAKALLEKCKRDGSDVYKALLNMRNIPRDSHLGSPVQRLMSQRTRTTVPTSPKLLIPQPIRKVTQNLRTVRLKKKKVYDRTARQHRELEIGQSVRIQTTKGHDRIGHVKQKADEPQSYIIVEKGREYRRNRRHILPVNEPRPAVPAPEEDDFEMPPQTAPTAPPPPVQTHTQRATTPAPPTPVRTRYGRVTRPPPKYKDYVMDKS